MAEGKGVPVILPRDDSYTSETHTAKLGEKTVTVEGKSPKLPPEEYRERYDAIRHGLYDIFIQYEDDTQAAGV